MELIADSVNKIIRKIFAKSNPVLAEIMINWNKIVGIKLSKKAHPYKIITLKNKEQKINILYIQVENSSISIEISFQKEIIISRTNVYLGFKAIDEIRLKVLQ